jgi:hypothetical protein
LFFETFYLPKCIKVKVGRCGCGSLEIHSDSATINAALVGTCRLSRAGFHGTLSSGIILFILMNFPLQTVHFPELIFLCVSGLSAVSAGAG